MLAAAAAQPPHRPRTWRSRGHLVHGIIAALLGSGWAMNGNGGLGALWGATAAIRIAQARFGDDVADPFARRRRRRVLAAVRNDPEFGPRLLHHSEVSRPWETQVSLPTGWTYTIRASAADAVGAVARAHLALTYRERNGLKGWIAADGTTGVNGAVVSVRELLPGTKADPWRVDYLSPRGRRFSR